MEISSLFSERDANFTRITGDRNHLYVNDFEQTTEINFHCKTEEGTSLMVNIPFELDSPFFYLVLDIKTNVPLLIGKLSNPKSFCKIPHVVNGFVIDHFFGEMLLAKDLVDVKTKVQVVCNPGYDLQNFERNTFKTCNSQGWNSEFPKCKSNI